MSNYLITGVAGTGKSTIGRELHRRGYRVVDTDRTWGRAIQLFAAKANAPPDSHVVLHSEHPANMYGEAWVWDIPKARRALKKRSSVKFFFGGADNEYSIYHLFDRIFILQADADCLYDRLQLRCGHITNTTDFIAKTFQEIVFRSRFSSKPNTITISTSEISPRASTEFILSHITEPAFDRRIRTLRVFLGLPWLSMQIYRGGKAWKSFTRKRRGFATASRVQ